MAGIFTSNAMRTDCLHENTKDLVQFVVVSKLTRKQRRQSI